MDYLKNVLTDTIPLIKTLPILHSLEAAYLSDILTSSELKTSLCDVFKENYLYAFYGIPSYRKTGLNPTGNPGFLPVCFILNYEKIPSLDFLYPFDTGAFAKIPEIKEKHFHTSTDLECLKLNPTIDDAKKIISYFYENNTNYINCQPVKQVDVIDSSKYNVWGYTSLINDKSASIYDNRVSTIELIFKKTITITKDNLLQIILPAPFLDNSNIKNQLLSMYGIDSPITYRNIKGNPSECFGCIYDKYLNFVEKHNLVI